MTQSVFYQRLQQFGPELRDLHEQLYHSKRDFVDFVAMLEQSFEQRSDALKTLDASREQNPEWFKGQDMLGMLVYTQCFGGNLKGIQSHLDYLQEAGINYLHLMPLLESPPDRSDGGYAVANFRKVQPSLGTMEDLADLTSACHEKNMAVCLDFVMNHSSEDHEWAVRAKNGEKEYQDRYFFYDNWDIPNEFEKKVPQVFPTTAPGNFSWCEEVQKVVMTTFYPYQWDLNYGNPVVLKEMTADMLYLCNQGVDVIRLDATPYIWKELGTDCRNLPQVHTLVRLMHLVCKIVCPGTLLLGEVVMEPSKVVPYFGTVEKPECHMLYNVTTMASLWHTVATADVRLLRHQLGTVFALPKQYTFLNYLRCHDDIGWGLDYPYLRQFGTEEVAHKKYLNDWFRGSYGSSARGELYNDDPRLGDARLCGTTASLCGMEVNLDQALKLDEMLHALLLSQSGIPVLYSGDEIGQKNDYTYHNDPLKAADSRYLHRGNLDWAAAGKRKNPDTVEGKIFNAIETLRKTRARNPAFHAQADVWVMDPHNDHVLAIGRYHGGQALVALFNFSSESQYVTIREEGSFADLLTGEKANIQSLMLPGYSFRWITEE